MLKSFFLLTLIVFSQVYASVPSHRSHYDHRGMRNCWINCEQKGLHHGEYYGYEALDR
ncbi:MAG: hypothetical protein JJU12_04785 [Chlamydiales bacterium]|nr:hypothetical protein [Chlamydiales bacterium]